MTGARIRRRPDVLWRRSLQAVVLLPAGSDEVITLAGTGPALWELLAEWRTEEDLVEMLARAYDVGTPEVATDVAPLLAEFRAREVVEIAAYGGDREAE